MIYGNGRIEKSIIRKIELASEKLKMEELGKDVLEMGKWTIGKSENEIREDDPVKQLIREMTLEEKAALCSGADNCLTKGVERLGVPAVWMADGPHGLRKQEKDADYEGKNDSKRSVCFPAGVTSASSFDPEVLGRIGRELGKLCQAENVHILLGPAVNIKRSPLCGRSFEYYSEDPLVASELGKAYVKALQQEGVGCSLKHFAANNQEYRRRTNSSNLDERTFREIYLAAFEGIVKEAKPWTVMSAYNKINGVFASENRTLLTEILREEWGFEGAVISDWTAVHTRAEAVKAGCDLTMPAAIDTNGDLVGAVQDGTLEEELLDKACENILRLTDRCLKAHRDGAEYDLEAGHRAARKIAEESMVLLKNEDGILPLSRESRIAFIGSFAKAPRYQGGGSSHINPYRVTSAWDAAQGMAQVTYAQGYVTDEDRIEEELKREAVQTAKQADVAVIFAGLPDNMESEGFDRWHMKMPKAQNDLIQAVADVQPNVVVVLHNGSPVEMPWIGEVKGLLEAGLGGEAAGEAVVNLLFGEAYPSGRLAETMPVKLAHNPSYLYYHGEGDVVEYREGVFVGYRYYETKEIDVLFPFGYGLSYTDFEYSSLSTDKTKMEAGDTIKVSVDVTNTGNRAGKEVVQLYVGADVEDTGIRRPVRELRGFKKIFLKPGETKTVEFVLDKRAFSYWDMEAHDFRIAGGSYEIQIGRSARDILLRCPVEADNEWLGGRKEFTMLTTIGEIKQHPEGRKIMDRLIPEFMELVMKMNFIQGDAAKVSAAAGAKAQAQGLDAQPLQILKRFLTGHSKEEWEEILKRLNG